MSFPLFFLVVALGLGGSGSRRRARLERLPEPSPFTRVPSERCIREERIEYDDEGVVRDAVQYAPCDWDPLPWTLTAWTDTSEDAEVFSLVPHPEIARADLRVTVFWSYGIVDNKEFIRNRGTQIDRDERFHNRLIDRHRGCSSGSYLIDVRFEGANVAFFHQRKEDRLEPGRVLIAAPVVTPVVEPNLFEDRLVRFIRIQEQYEAAKKQALLRKLPPDIEQSVLYELERVFQDEVAKLEEGKSDDR